jgi:RimJ/RimL family protein N-acetyltransferase
MSAVDTVALRPFERRHLQRTLAWANDPEFARLLDRPAPIGADEHERWFSSLADRPDTLYLAIELDQEARHVGNVWLADIDRRHRKAEVRVIIGEREHLGRGVGSRALDLMARHAFDRMGLHRVYAYVLAFNPRARLAFEKAGFLLEGTLRDDRWDGTQFTDTFVLGRVSVPSQT